MIIIAAALAIVSGLTFATFYALSRENRAEMYNSLKLSNRSQFAE